MTVLACPMTFEQMKTAALQVLEDRLRGYQIKDGERVMGAETRPELLDGIAHDIAGRIDRESM